MGNITKAPKYLLIWGLFLGLTGGKQVLAAEDNINSSKSPISDVTKFKQLEFPNTQTKQLLARGGGGGHGGSGGRGGGGRSFSSRSSGSRSFSGRSSGRSFSGRSSGSRSFSGKSSGRSYSGKSGRSGRSISGKSASGKRTMGKKTTTGKKTMGKKTTGKKTTGKKTMGKKGTRGTKGKKSAKGTVKKGKGGKGKGGKGRHHKGHHHHEHNHHHHQGHHGHHGYHWRGHTWWHHGYWGWGFGIGWGAFAWWGLGWDPFFYPAWGYWWFSGWNSWFYPWGPGYWYFPDFWTWYWPVWGFSALLYAANASNPYVVVTKEDAAPAYFAVYQTQEDANGNVMYIQTEAPRIIKENMRIYIKNRMPDEVIILANAKSKLGSELSENEAEALSIIELNDVKSIQKNTVSGPIETGPIDDNDEQQIAKAHEKTVANKAKLIQAGKQALKEDTSKYVKEAEEADQAVKRGEIKLTKEDLAEAKDLPQNVE